MNREKIDIHNTANKYEHAIKQLKEDGTISETNKELFLAFLRDAIVGKTIINRQKKNICKRTCLKYLYNLKTVAFFLKKDFTKVTKKEMEDFIFALEDDSILKKNRVSYADETKKDFKVALKKFYKWLYGNNKIYPEIVGWLDTFCPAKDISALTAQQIEKVVQIAKRKIDKALVTVLFDLGARAEEFLNIHIEDITKTENSFKIHLKFSKTFSRTLPLDRSVGHLKRWLENHHGKGQLFPVTYNQCRNKLKQLGKKAIDIEITPQIIRHSKATQLAQAGVGRYQMCEWMGWAMSSKMPDRYIRREGIDNEKTLAMIKQKQAQIEG